MGVKPAGKDNKVYKLPAKWINHSLGPLWQGKIRGEDGLWLLAIEILGASG
jgi:hypothetical protein